MALIEGLVPWRYVYLPAGNDDGYGQRLVSSLTSPHNWTKNWNKLPWHEVRRGTRLALKAARVAQGVSEPLKVWQ